MSQVGFLLLLLCSLSFPLASQLRSPVRVPPPPTEGGRPWLAAASQTVRVLGVMVQFRADEDPRTSGTGRFMMTGSARQIDPPPHDSLYFSSKLLFLRNYFQKASNGLMTVLTDLFPLVVNLPDSMARYSPRSGDHRPLADLVGETWTAANALDSTFVFSQYDAFVIFHAGVGRDIDLVSLFGFDPTPNDIPSVFLALETLRRYLDNPSYQGVSVSGGTFFITNSLIIPETETRVFVSGSRADTLQLGINGLLAASFGSFLGLPDLFDTETGRSGIGQFGLMDGAGIFAFNGLFPPEPSAWEKAYLGWTVPIVVDSNPALVTLPAAGLTRTGSDTVYKIPVTAREYFLVENRVRDPEFDGQTLTILDQGVLTSKHFGGDTAGFVFHDLSAVHGSLVDVQNFDWALPGSTLQPGFGGGGILIWHVDESDLLSRIATNTVNRHADRAIDLEEADGSQDIGEQYEFLQPGSGTENGWPLDFWFDGNSSPAYENRFGESTFPDSRSNTGAATLISVAGFGPVASRATATINVGNSRARRIFRTPRLPVSGHVSVAATDSGVFVASPAGIAAFRRDGSSRTLTSSGVVDTQGTAFALAVRDGNPLTLVAVRESLLTIRSLSDTDNDGRLDMNTMTTTGLGSAASTHPVIIDSMGTARILVGCEDGRLRSYSLGGMLTDEWTADSLAIRGLLWLPPQPAFPAGHIVVSTSGGLRSRQQSLDLPGRGQPEQIRGVNLDGAQTFVSADDPLGYSLFNNQLSPGRSVRLGNIPVPLDSPFSALVPTDLDRDGHLDVVAVSGSTLLAFNAEGNPLDGFPVDLGSDLTGGPLVKEMNGDNRPDLIVLTETGSMWIIESDGSIMDGFPLQATVEGATWPVVFESPSGMTGLLVPSGDGGADAWEIDHLYSTSAAEWRQPYGGPTNTSSIAFSTMGSVPLSQSLFPSNRVYNWPNPVYGSSTHIRYYTAQPAAISVKILTLSGDLVTELQGQAAGGVDGEIPWDVSGIESGVYFARVEASGAWGQAIKIIKIAVVK